MPVTVSFPNEALLSFAQRKREPLPAVADFVPPPEWPEMALRATTMVWTRRLVNETHSVELGELLLSCFARTGLLSAELRAAIERLIADEQSHVDLARAFLARLGAPPSVVAPAFVEEEDPRVRLLRAVTTGLTICEAVSAARFAAVRPHTDLAIPRACIEYFLRDEIAHAELGYVLLPSVLEYCSHELGAESTDVLFARELRATFLELESVVGMNAERKKIELVDRPQPPLNAGVVEPMVDAAAFYAAMARSVLPRLRRLGLRVDAEAIWANRSAPGGLPRAGR